MRLGARVLVIAGHFFVEAEKRDAYVRALRDVVCHARAMPGCLDFAITADALDPMRINNYELWESEDDCDAFREAVSQPEFDVELFAVHMSRFDVIASSGTFDEASRVGDRRRN